MPEPRPLPATTDQRRAALDGVAAAYLELLDPRAAFSAIPGDLVERAIDAWSARQANATTTWDAARRTAFPHGARDHGNLVGLAEALLDRGHPLAAAAVHAERLRASDYRERAFRTRRADIEQSIARLLEQADRPRDALQMYLSAFEGFSADPHRSASVRECRDAVNRVLDALGDADGATVQVAQARAEEAVAAEVERLAREDRETFANGRSTDGTTRSEFRSTEELLDRCKQHLDDKEYGRAEAVAREIHTRFTGWAPTFHGILNATMLAGLLEARGRAAEAEPLRETAYRASARLYGPGDPRTLEVVRDYVDNLRLSGQYEKSSAVAKAAQRKAGRALGKARRIRDLLRSPGLRGLPSVVGKALDAAITSLSISHQLSHVRALTGFESVEAGQGARPGGEVRQGPPQLYTNTGHRLRDAVGGTHRDGRARQALSGMRRAVTGNRPGAPRTLG
ncbi:hypothetical protein ACIBFB_07245 [Nocardiopsis sp. NPDC050513]|uniref:hypothetical protein n=1 Tax=Nocardiopsis sp. NPDC050513 TaxID=3364338 RepID=UPI0037AFEB20